MSTIDATAKGGNIAMAILLDFLNHSCKAKVIYIYIYIYILFMIINLHIIISLVIKENK